MADKNKDIAVASLEDRGYTPYFGESNMARITDDEINTYVDFNNIWEDYQVSSFEEAREIIKVLVKAYGVRVLEASL